MISVQTSSIVKLLEHAIVGLTGDRRAEATSATGRKEQGALLWHPPVCSQRGAETWRYQDL